MFKISTISSSIIRKYILNPDKIHNNIRKTNIVLDQHLSRFSSKIRKKRLQN